MSETPMAVDRKLAALEFLRAIERREIALTCLEPDGPDWGNVRYRASNGWELVVFNDCGDWDYIDRIVTPAWTLSYDEIDGELAAYSPPYEVARQCYGINS